MPWEYMDVTLAYLVTRIYNFYTLAVDDLKYLLKWRRNPSTIHVDELDHKLLWASVNQQKYI